MESKDLPNSYKAIAHLLRSSTEAESIDWILRQLNPAPDRRTVQRHLKEMETLGLVIKEGRARATRYKIKPDPTDIETTSRSVDSIFPLSDPAKEILAHVRQPVQLREPVGYNRAFLETYQPNKTSYLTDEQKKHLAAIGATSQMQAPAGTYAKQILQRLLIDLAWNSSRLEGNTYSLLDTQILLQEGSAATGKQPSETQMIVNHKDAIEFIVENLDHIGFNRYTINNLHGLLSNNLLPNPSASGRLRIHAVGIGGSTYTPPSTPQQIEELYELMLEKATAIEDPFEQAFFIMVHLPYLQPFDDVNKRVSRLAANIPLNNQNLSPLSFTDVPQDLYVSGLLGIYELEKVELMRDIFLWAYERSAKLYAVQRQSLGEPDPFRMKYRNQMRMLITDIIREKRSKEGANILIKAYALSMPDADSDNFMRVVEEELLNMHEGNSARYAVTPNEFRNWEAVWNGREDT